MNIDELEQKAISFIKTVVNSADKPLYAGNSAGKDSVVVDKLLQLSNIKYESYHTNTTIDPIGTLQLLREHYPHTKIIQPKESFYNLVKRKGFPTRLNRYCCEFLKEYGSIGKIVFEGVRSEESSKRKNRDYIQCDDRAWQQGAQHVYPIYDWTEKNVFDFIEKYNLPLHPHYKKFNRLGCIACPLVSKKGQREKELKEYPRYYYLFKKAIHIGMSNNPQWKLTCATNGNAGLAMDWWLSGKTINEYFSEYDFKMKTGKRKDGWIKIRK